MSANELISRLERVSQTSSGNWKACCPAHPDKHPSLTVKEADDGRVLVHCFAECSVESILSAVGLDFDALFPEKPISGHVAKPERLRFNPRDILDAVSKELTVAAVIASDMSRGETISEEDRKRLLLCAERIEQARRMAND